MCGWTDPDNRRTYPWEHEDKELIQFHKDMIRIHKSYEALKSGSVLYLHGGHKILCYGRFTDNKQVVVIMNTNYEDVDLKLHIRQIGVYNHSILRRVMLTNGRGLYTGATGFHGGAQRTHDQSSEDECDGACSCLMAGRQRYTRQRYMT